MPTIPHNKAPLVSVASPSYAAKKRSLSLSADYAKAGVFTGSSKEKELLNVLKGVGGTVDRAINIGGHFARAQDKKNAMQAFQEYTEKSLEFFDRGLVEEEPQAVFNNQTADEDLVAAKSSQFSWQEKQEKLEEIRNDLYAKLPKASQDIFLESAKDWDAQRNYLASKEEAEQERSSFFEADKLAASAYMSQALSKAEDTEHFTQSLAKAKSHLASMADLLSYEGDSHAAFVEQGVSEIVRHRVENLLEKNKLVTAKSILDEDPLLNESDRERARELLAAKQKMFLETSLQSRPAQMLALLLDPEERAVKEQELDFYQDILTNKAALPDNLKQALLLKYGSFKNIQALSKKQLEQVDEASKGSLLASSADNTEQDYMDLSLSSSLLSDSSTSLS